MEWTDADLYIRMALRYDLDSSEVNSLDDCYETIMKELNFVPGGCYVNWNKINKQLTG